MDNNRGRPTPGHYYRAARRRVLTPALSQTRMDVRGFDRTSPAAQQLLEEVGSSFLAGYACAAQARIVSEVTAELAAMPTQFRGFAYEGAAMGFAMRDQLRLGRARMSEQFLAGPGEPHEYMAYVGIGWSMGRLPRFRWPDCRQLDPTLRWLVLDGYGFHQAYFHTDRYVRQQYRDPGFRWSAGDGRYEQHAIDQGIGRALWFVAGASPVGISALVDRFDRSRRPDLWGGIGLAATYAGGSDAAALRQLRELAEPYSSNLAQGAAFACEARVRAGLLVEHSDAAARVLCGVTAVEAAAVTRRVRPGPGPLFGVPSYEVWRTRIATELSDAAAQAVPG